MTKARLAEPCTGCGTETACAFYNGDRKVPLCPECVERVRFEPGAREILLAEGPPGHHDDPLARPS